MARTRDIQTTATSSRPDSGTLSTHRQPNSALLLALLHRTEGATIAQITAATGWLPHSARAALSGLRKKGHAISRIAEEGSTIYRIVEQPR